MDNPNQSGGPHHILDRVYRTLGWSVCFETRIEPTLPSTRRRIATLEHLKYQLSRLVESPYTLQRLIHASRDRFESAWNDLTPDDIGELNSWLNSRAEAAKGEARVKWGIVASVFWGVREACCG